MSKRQMAESECRQCYARILWATNSATGRPLPLNLRPEKVTGTSTGPFYLLDEIEVIASRASTDVIEQARLKRDGSFGRIIW